MYIHLPHLAHRRLMAVAGGRHAGIFRKKGIFIPVSARVLHTTNSYYKSSLLLFFKLSKSKTKKENID